VTEGLLGAQRMYSAYNFIIYIKRPQEHDGKYARGHIPPAVTTHARESRIADIGHWELREKLLIMSYEPCWVYSSYKGNWGVGSPFSSVLWSSVPRKMLQTGLVENRD
jgi:hypothetical protein